MKRTLSIFVSLCTALVVQAAPGDTVTKANTGTTSTQTIFASGAKEITQFDATGSDATNRLYFFPGTSRVSNRRTQVANTTNIILPYVTWNTNDVLLFENSAGALTNKTITIRAYTTNKLVTLGGPIGTNLAVGDTMKERLTGIVYRPITMQASDVTTLRLNNTTGLADSDVLLLDNGAGQTLKTATISSIATNAYVYTPLNTAVRVPLAAGTILHRQQTNAPALIITNLPASATDLKLSATNGMDVGTNLLFLGPGIAEIQIIDSISRTNVTLVGATTYAHTTNSRVYVLGAERTIILPVNAGDSSLILSASTGLASNDVVAIATTPPFVSRIGALPATNLYAVAVSAAFSTVINPSSAIYKLTNTLTLAFAADHQDQRVIVNASTGLTPGDPVILLPATGGVFANTALSPIQDDILTTLTFASAVGLALTLNEGVWLEGSSVNTLIGNANVARQGAPLYASPGRGPLRVWLSGGASCSINSVTAKY
jgi:hypothetical protein